MAFNVRVAFTGICAVVPDVPFGGDVKAKEVLVVLPNGWSNTLTFPTSAQDNSDLLRHRSFVKFNIDNLGVPDNYPKAMDGVWYLQQSFVTIQYAGGANPFNPVDLKYLGNMKDVAGKYSIVDPDAIKNPPSDNVAVQVFFNTGAVSAENTYGTWVFPNTLSGEKKVVTKIATELVVTYQNLTKFSLLATPFSGSAGTKGELPLKAADGETVKVTISNLCDQNPLRWYTEYDYLPPDEDFKWYFELLKQQDKDTLPSDLQGLSLPIPYFKDKLNGQGANCFIIEMARP